MTLKARQVAEPTVLVDDDRVKVTRWDFAPGAETGWHRHGMDYVVTTLTPCAFVLEEPAAAARTVEMEAGLPIAGTRASSTMSSMAARRRWRLSRWN